MTTEKLLDENINTENEITEKDSQKILPKKRIYLYTYFGII